MEASEKKEIVGGKTRIAIIAIVARDGAIGRGGDQPFHISADFRRFKQLTMGCPVIMGRKTFEALPKGALPGRRNIVVTRSATWQAPGAETAPSVAAAVGMVAGVETAFVIGGGEVYRQSMALADELYITEVDADVPDADTYFPEVNSADWQIKEESDWMSDPRSGSRFRFVSAVRR